MMSHRINGFPRASESASVVYHNGISEEEVAAAKELGYTCEDVRFIPGIAGIKATLLGLRMGTVAMNREQITALRAEAEVWEKVPNELASNASAGAKSVEDLLGSLRGNDNYAKLYKVEVKAKGVKDSDGGGFHVKRPRGRPRKYFGDE